MSEALVCTDTYLHKAFRRESERGECVQGPRGTRQGPGMVSTEKQNDPYQIRIGEERRRPAIS
jgi:hypothetical protein